jgi:hypothetical protein
MNDLQIILLVVGVLLIFEIGLSWQESVRTKRLLDQIAKIIEQIEVEEDPDA